MVSTIEATGKFFTKVKFYKKSRAKKLLHLCEQNQKLQREPETQRPKKHQTNVVAGEEVMKSVVDSSHAHPAATSRSQQGNLGPAAEACQQAVKEA